MSASQIRVLFILEHSDGIRRLCDRFQAVGSRLRLSRRGRTFLTELRARREAALQSVPEQIPVTQHTALLEGLEAF